jgi:hypothetical protein
MSRNRSKKSRDLPKGLLYYGLPPFEPPGTPSSFIGHVDLFFSFSATDVLAVRPSSVGVDRFALVGCVFGRSDRVCGERNFNERGGRCAG